MAQQEVVNGQLQPVIASMVAGVNWGQTFIAENVVPPTNTFGQHFSFETWGNEGLVDQGTTKRGINAESKELTPPKNGSVTTDLEEYSAKMPLDYTLIEAARVQDLVRRVAPEGLSSVDRLRLGRARVIQFNNQIQKEKAVASVVFNGGSYDAGLQSAAINFGSTGIVDTFFAAKRAVARSYGFEPDTLVLGYTSFELLLKNADFLDRVKGGSTNADPALVNLDLIARVLGVPRVSVGSAVVQTLATPGQAGTPTDLWTPDSAAFIYTGAFESADLASPSFAKLFYMNVPETGVRYHVRTWMNDEGNIEWVKAAEFFLAAQIMKAGYYWTNTDQN